MKLVVYVYRHYFTSDQTTWWAATDFTENYLLEDTFLEATQQQRWTLPTHINGHDPHPIILDPPQFELHPNPPAEESATPVDTVV
jgi:hypothetical protein